jgi:hypothetical protein
MSYEIDALSRKVLQRFGKKVLHRAECDASDASAPYGAKERGGYRARDEAYERELTARLRRLLTPGTPETPESRGQR